MTVRIVRKTSLEQPYRTIYDNVSSITESAHFVIVKDEYLTYWFNIDNILEIRVEEANNE